MDERKKTAIWVLILSTILVLIVWHVIDWHSRGTYLEMFKWSQAGRGYLVALYNLGLMLILGGLLGFLMSKITDLVGYKVREMKPSEDETGANKTK